ncbi:MAG: multimodular transpeptidase-transglycosylase [Firmicutes bacterium]|nr:multimodular transpeptidase-transglycosylase [Bacillota bacterium]
MGEKPKKPRKPAKPSKTGKSRKINKRKILYALIGVFVFTCLAAGGAGIAIISGAPELDVNNITNMSQPSQLYDDKGEYMDTVKSSENRIAVKYSEMPQDLKNAIVSIEDERFYKHPGIDIKRIISIIFIDIKNKLTGSDNLQGASTITQQLIKMTTLTSEVTITRKVQEWYLALKLEKVLSKDQILESYLNTIYLGGSAYGVEAASRQYFSKSVGELSLLECAYIAGVPQSPSVYYAYSSTSKKNPSVYINRTKAVLSRMLYNEYITQEQYDQAISDLDSGKLVFEAQATQSERMNYEWFSLPVIEQVKKDLKEKLNYTDEEVARAISSGGLKIYTTMNKTMQDSTQEVLNSGLGGGADSNGILTPQASAVIMDYHSGEVKVIVGGRGDQPALSYNRAASEKYLRPAGSSIKPLTVYSAAIDSKKATAATLIEDSPLDASIGAIYGSEAEPYDPKNDNLTYSGMNTLRSAIMKSINLVAVKLEHTMGLKTGISYGEKYGLTFDEHDKTSIAALALGQLHHGTNPLKMAAAYGVFGNEGNYTQPILYTKVMDNTGTVILESEKTTREVISADSAFVMYDLLKGPVSSGGTGPAANFGDIEVRGKTGTTSDKRDLWFCGLTPYYSGAVWIGNDDNSVTVNVSSNTAAGLWGKIMASAHEGLEPKTISQPSGVTTASVCSVSGKLATDACENDPRGSTVITDYFIQGSIPTEMCDAHISVEVNKITGLLAGPFTPDFLKETRIYLKSGYTTDPALLLPTEQDPTTLDTVIEGYSDSLQQNQSNNNPNNSNNSNNNTAQ